MERELRLLLLRLLLLVLPMERELRLLLPRLLLLLLVLPMEWELLHRRRCQKAGRLQMTLQGEPTITSSAIHMELNNGTYLPHLHLLLLPPLRLLVLLLLVPVMERQLQLLLVPVMERQLQLRLPKHL
jgi:hypothetical protein